MGKQTLEKTKEIEIQGDCLEKFYPIITMVAAELRFRNHFYEARLANSKATNTSAWFDVLIINRTTADSTPIGVLTLESPRSNRTTLRVPPRSQWLHGDLSPRELTIMAYIEKDKDAIEFYDKHFTKFIKCLKDELKGTPFKLLWQWIKSHLRLSIFITFLVVVITLLGTNWAIVEENLIKVLEFFR